MAEDNRWTGFSDEELRSLRADEKMLEAELNLELQRRKDEQSTYRGPGRYVGYGRRLEVLGTIDDPDAMDTQAQVVMRDEGDHSGVLMQESLSQFNEVNAIDRRRRYEYLGPLEENVTTAPAEVTLVRAGLDEAVLRIGNSAELNLGVGDTIAVPIVVVS